MPPLPLRLFALFLALGLSACDDAPRFTKAEPGEARSGGSATVRKTDQNAFSLPSANLPPSRRVDFSVGNSFFRSPWVIAPSTTTARDGLGPLFNTNACQGCHIKDGRGHPPGPDAPNAVSMLVRLSIPDAPAYAKIIEQQGVVPEPVYGGQFQDMAVPGVTPEGKVRVDYTPVPVRFKDGAEIELRKPSLSITQLGYGPMHPDTRFSARVAPPMIGLGLLEAIPEDAILANAAAQARDNKGIAGRPNRVWDDAQQKTVLGRFGWKAGQPNLNQQNVHAFSGDMGLTTSLRPFDDCTDTQTACNRRPVAMAPMASRKSATTSCAWCCSTPATLPYRPAAMSARQKCWRARTCFQAGCQSCHTPKYTTAANAAEPELANQVIRPYSDLLLHDMGDGLADNRSEFQAGGRDWRTPPLWGIGLTQAVSGHTQFLHDGRARNLLEAVLWHGGEAKAAQQQVLTFNAEQRAALLAFLNSL